MTGWGSGAGTATGREVGGATWWWPGGDDDHRRPVLFLPPAGADQTIVRPLVAHVPGMRLGVLRMPGRGLRFAEPAPPDLADLVGSLADQVGRLRGPAPMIVGHSVGGLFGYALALELQRRGMSPAALITVASASPSAWARELQAHDVDLSPESVDAFVPRRVDHLLRLGGVPGEVAGEVRSAAVTAMGQDVRLSCHAFPAGGLTCPVTAVTARQDAFVGTAATAGWRDVTTGPVHTVTLPGGHFPYRDHPGPFAGLLLGELEQLDGAYGQSA